MSSLKEFADSLSEEILSEAANTFIDERKKIEITELISNFIRLKKPKF